MLALVMSLGCGPSKPDVVPVSGVVTLDGQPLTTGSIQFIPKDNRPAYAQIGSDGKFTLETDDEKGAVVGSHQVVVTAQEIVGTPETGEQVKYIAPERYGSLETTDLTVDVQGPRDDVKIELTSP